MRERWILFYDGACPLCFKAQSKLSNLISKNIRLTSVDLNSEISKSKQYNRSKVVLETSNKTYHGYSAWLKILSQTKYKWFTNVMLRPLFILFYFFVSHNRKLINKII